MSGFTFDIKADISSPAVRQEPIIGRWYCHFESIVSRPGIPVEREYECDGNLGKYIGDGDFVDEDDFPIDMTSDLNSPWAEYLVLQD